LREGKKFLRNTKEKQMGQNLQIVYRQPKNLQRIAGGCKKIKEDNLFRGQAHTNATGAA
jgi:hypothetical protein